MGVAERYDILIVGGTVAGGAAAVRARQLGLSTMIVETGLPPAQGVLGWFHQGAAALARRCGLEPARAGGAWFEGVTLHSPDFRRRIEVKHEDLSGWVLRCDRVAQALLELAEASGAERCSGALAEVALGETSASVTLGDRTARHGSVLLIDDGPQSAAARLARLPRAGESRGTRCVSVSSESPERSGRIDVVLAAGRTSGLGFVARAERFVQASLLGAEAAGDAELHAFVSGAQASGVFPSSAAVRRDECARPAGVALDMEAHVGKRSILIGCAGGFVAAFNCDLLYPAMRSGWLAAETAARAIAAPLLQDDLATFDMAWRTELADYLRRPNTDLSLLLPLVFNEGLQMSERVARAFLLGEKF